MSSSFSTVIGLLLALSAGIALGFIIGGLKKGSTSQAQILELTNQSSTLATSLVAEQARSATLADEVTKMRNENTERERFDASLNAVRESITKISEAAVNEDKRRIEAETSLKAQMAQMAEQGQSLLLETTRLAGALSHSQARGKYGEAQLEMLLKSAGLIEDIHFTKQSSRDGIRPDISINIPGGAEIFIDSKFPFDSFFTAIAETDPLVRAEGMKEHARALMNHVNDLSKKEYQKQGNSPDYVLLFVPFESILSEAVEVNPNLLNDAFAKNISIATPTTMLAMLRTVAHVYSQSNMAANAEEIKSLAARFLQRAGIVHEKISKLGENIKTTERAFNSLVETAENNLLVPAREMAEKGVPARGSMERIPDIEIGVRAIKSSRRAIGSPEESALEGGEFEDGESEGDN